MFTTAGRFFSGNLVFPASMTMALGRCDELADAVLLVKHHIDNVLEIGAKLRAHALEVIYTDPAYLGFFEYFSRFKYFGRKALL